MASTTETAKAYFGALSEHDVAGALALWRAGGVDHLSGPGDLAAPEQLRELLEELFGAFPDWRFTVLETTTYRERCAVRWRATATFAGPGRLSGYRATGRRLDFEGCDVLTVKDSQIVSNHVYVDRAEMFAQLGLVTPDGSLAHRRRVLGANLRTAARRPLSGGEPTVIAPGVWLLRGHSHASMNVYLLAEDDGSITVFDAGTRVMRPAIAAAAARLGGLGRFVLGHADCDHRGGAFGLDVPVYAHALEVEAAQSAAHRRPYWDLSKLKPSARLAFPLLFRLWDGGPLPIAGTLAEGDEVAGFTVIELPGHAPGLIGLFREEDGLALCSDVLYTLDPESGLPGHARMPHAAFNLDIEQARASVMKLAQLNPRVVWVGHAGPVSGPDVVEQLIRVAQS